MDQVLIIQLLPSTIITVLTIGLSDPFGAWLDSGSQVYCASTSQTYSQLHCDVETMILKCPDATTDQSTQGIA